MLVSDRQFENRSKRVKDFVFGEFAQKQAFKRPSFELPDTVVFLGNSYLTDNFGDRLIPYFKKVYIYDPSQNVKNFPELERVDTLKLSQLVGKMKCALIDFWSESEGRVFAEKLTKMLRAQTFDATQVLQHFGVRVVYETIDDLRNKIIENSEIWIRNADFFEDPLSRLTYWSFIAARLSGDRKYLIDTYVPDEYFQKNTVGWSFPIREHEVFVDGGASDGAVSDHLAKVTAGRYGKIYAIEPDPENFKKLSQLKHRNFYPMHAALGATSGRQGFEFKGGFGGQADPKASTQIDFVTIDESCSDATLIKLDLEGYEPSALLGAKKVLKENRPRLSISAYHYYNDLPAIIATIKELNPDYHFALRHHSTFFYDTILYGWVEN